MTGTRATFELSELEDASFTVTSWNLPGVNAGSPRQPTPFVDIPLRGDKLVFEPLQVEFIVTEDMSNWRAMYDWIVGITAPRNFGEFRNKPHEYMDGTINIYSSHNNKILVAQFHHLVPISLSGIQFSAGDGDTTYIKATVDLMYQDYELILER